MSEPAPPAGAAAPAAVTGHDAGPGFGTYIAVFALLAGLTAVSFGVNLAEHTYDLGKTVAFALILGVAVVKAVMVAVYFMHLITDWSKLYYLIIPGIILGMVLMVVLVPDMVLAWREPAGP